MNDLILEYKKGKKALERMKENTVDQEEVKIINSMIYDMEFAIKWMKLGYRPQYRSKGAESIGAYERSLLLNMDVFPTPDDEAEDAIELKVSEERRKAVKYILATLTEKQLSCFLLHYVHQMSMQQIADEMGVRKVTVQHHIESARKKIKKVLKQMRKIEGENTFAIR